MMEIPPVGIVQRSDTLEGARATALGGDARGHVGLPDVDRAAILGNPEQHAQGVEARGPVDERHAARDQAPGDENPREPLARAPSFDHQSARDLQGHVADEENANPHAKHVIVEPKVASHSNRRVSHTGAVKVVGDVKNEKKWEQSKRNAAPCVFSSGAPLSKVGRRPKLATPSSSLPKLRARSPSSSARLESNR